MKKELIVALLLLTVSGCQSEEKKEETPKIASSIPEVKRLEELPDYPEAEDAIFIITNGETYNEDLWKKFKENTEEQESAELIIARYTIEGDVIYELLRYDGERYTLYYDNSRDSYAGILPDPLSRKYIYELDYITMEETGDVQKPFRNHFAFLSDTFYEGEEEVKEAFERMREGEQIDLVDVFSDVRLCE